MISKDFGKIPGFQDTRRSDPQEVTTSDRGWRFGSVCHPHSDSRFKIQLFCQPRLIQDSRFKIQDSVLRSRICQPRSIQDSRFSLKTVNLPYRFVCFPTPQNNPGPGNFGNFKHFEVWCRTKQTSSLGCIIRALLVYENDTSQAPLEFMNIRTAAPHSERFRGRTPCMKLPVSRLFPTAPT